MIPTLYITRTPDGTGFPLPSYPSRDHAALRLSAAVSAPLRIAPGERVRVPVGFAVGIPRGFVGQLLSDPNLAEQAGLIVSDAPHLLNPVDREPIFVLIQNVSSNPHILHRGDPIAQLLIIPAVQVAWREVHVAGIDVEEPTDEADMVVDPGQDQNSETVSDKFKSFRRKKTSIRNRFKSADDEEG